MISFAAFPFANVIKFAAIAAFFSFIVYQIYNNGHEAGYLKAEASYNKQMLSAKAEYDIRLANDLQKAIKEYELVKELDEEASLATDVIEANVADTVREVTRTITRTEIKYECRNVPDVFVGLLNDTVRAGYANDRSNSGGGNADINEVTRPRGFENALRNTERI